MLAYEVTLIDGTVFTVLSSFECELFDSMRDRFGNYPQKIIRLIDGKLLDKQTS